MLEIQDVNTFYGKIQALWGVTMSIREAEIVALIGANGAGKSTLLNTVSGIVRSTTGTITFQGQRIDNMPPHHIVDLGISQIPEGGKPFLDMTVRENLELGAYPNRSWRKQGATIEEIFRLFPRLKERKNQLARTLSGGEKQMLAMGRGLMSKPRLCMFDEPSYGLAPIVVLEVFRIIKELQGQGITVLLIEQNVKRTFNITAGADGIQAKTALLINAGNYTISTGGGSGNSSSKIGTSGNTWGQWPGGTTTASTSASAKGLKAGGSITVTGGTISIDSSDDSLNSNKTAVISGGSLNLTSGDDGIHADASIQIDGGEINIKKSYEGIESEAITINNGNIHLVSSDDGFNAAGGVDGSSVNGRPGQNPFAEGGSSYLSVNGGYIYVDAIGDGLDINGTFSMTSGMVIVNGPSANFNGALDHGGFTMTGGYLVAAGSSGMAMAPSTTSTQYSIMVNFSTALAAGTLVHIETSAGEELLTLAPTKMYQSVVICSPEIRKGIDYNIFTGGSTSGSAADSLYSGGQYTAGTKAYSVTISSIVTTAGTVSRWGMRP